MKKLKKNQLKLDKEVVASLSGAELSKVVGGGTVYLCNTILPDCKPQSENICEIISINRPCFETDQCSKECLITEGGKPCLLSADGGLTICLCQLETKSNG